jgi:hypothetical protein
VFREQLFQGEWFRATSLRKASSTAGSSGSLKEVALDACRLLRVDSQQLDGNLQGKRYKYLNSGARGLICCTAASTAGSSVSTVSSLTATYKKTVRVAAGSAGMQ